MVHSCCACGCKERFVKGSGISFHRWANLVSRCLYLSVRKWFWWIILRVEWIIVIFGHGRRASWNVSLAHLSEYYHLPDFLCSHFKIYSYMCIIFSTYHSFPNDQELKKKWIVALRRDAFVPTVYSKLCSKHFARQCFVQERFGGRWLKPDAVPTLFEFPHHLTKKDSQRKPPKSRSLFSASTPCEALHQGGIGKFSYISLDIFIPLRWYNICLFSESVQSGEICAPGDGNPQMESPQPGNKSAN